MFDIPTFDQFIKQMRAMRPQEVGLLASMAFSPFFIVGLMGPGNRGIRLDPFKLSKYIHPKYFFGEGAEDEEIEPHPRIARKERKKKKNAEDGQNIIKKSSYTELIARRMLEKLADISQRNAPIGFPRKYQVDHDKNTDLFLDNIFGNQQLPLDQTVDQNVINSPEKYLSFLPKTTVDAQAAKLKELANKGQEEAKQPPPGQPGDGQVGGPPAAPKKGPSDVKLPEYGPIHATVIRSRISELPKDIGGMPKEEAIKQVKELLRYNITSGLEDYLSLLRAKEDEIRRSGDEELLRRYNSNVGFVEAVINTIRFRIEDIMHPEYDPEKRVKSIAAYKNMAAMLYESGIDEMIRRYNKLGINSKGALVMAMMDPKHPIHEVIPAQMAMNEYLDKTSTMHFWHELDPIHKLAIGAGISLAGLALLSAITGGDRAVYMMLAISGLLSSGYGLTRGFSRWPFSNPNITKATPEIRAKAGSNILAYGSSLLVLSAEDPEKFDKLMELMNDEEREISKSAIDLAVWVARSGNMPAIDIFGDINYSPREIKFFSDIYDSFLKVFGLGSDQQKTDAEPPPPSPEQPGQQGNVQGGHNIGGTGTTPQQTTGKVESTANVNTQQAQQNVRAVPQMPKSLADEIQRLHAKDIKGAAAIIDSKLSLLSGAPHVSGFPLFMPPRSVVADELDRLMTIMEDESAGDYIIHLARNDNEFRKILLSIHNKLGNAIDFLKRNFKSDTRIKSLVNRLELSPTYNKILREFGGSNNRR